MSQSSEGYVPVPTLASGTNVRNLVQTLTEAGIPVTVSMQVVVAADKDGYVADVAGNRLETLLRGILRELRAANAMQAAASGYFYVPPPDDDIG